MGVEEICECAACLTYGPLHVLPEEQAPAICTDCGDAPVWRYSNGKSYCRDCYSDNGYDTWRELDPDKLEKLLGRSLTDRVLAKCSRW